jgi:hypothetical protein
MVHRILGPALVSGVALVGIAASPSLARAFCRTTTCAVTSPPPECERDANGCWAAGTPLFWEEPCVSISVSNAGSPKRGIDYATAEAAAVFGFGLWWIGMCPDGFPSISIMSRGPLMCDRREFNATGPNANAILFRDEGWSYDPSTIAQTTVAFNTTTGKILGADMEINSDLFELPTLSLEYIIGHEAGHFLGLDHSSDPTALMYFSYALDSTVEPMLQDDDRAAICDAYPPSRMTPACDFEPSHGFAADCGGNVSASCAVSSGRPTVGRVGVTVVALILTAAGIGRWRRRRRTQSGLCGHPHR